MNHAVSRPLVALVLVGAFTTWAMIPPSDVGPREGRLLTYLDVQSMAAGEHAQTAFDVDDFYDTIELNYNISAAAKVRAALASPTGARHVAQADPATDTLTLVVPKPEQGTWHLEVWTLNDSESQGFIQHGNFTVLGFGGTLRFV